MVRVFAAIRTPEDADCGDDPDKRDDRTDVECDMRSIVGDRNAAGVDGERSPMLDLGRYVELGAAPFALELAVHGVAEQEKSYSSGEHADAVDGYRERVEVHVDVIREKGDQRECEEPEEIRPENAVVGSVEPADEGVVIDPVDADVREGERIDQQGRDDWSKGCKAAVRRHFQVEHHDRDDDSDDAVGEGF